MSAPVARNSTADAAAAPACHLGSVEFNPKVQVGTEYPWTCLVSALEHGRELGSGEEGVADCPKLYLKEQGAPADWARAAGSAGHGGKSCHHIGFSTQARG